MNKDAQESKTVQKPIMLLREEFIRGLSDLVGNSGMPLFIVEPILRDVLNEVNMELRKQYKLEMAQYEESLRNINKNGE